MSYSLAVSEELDRAFQKLKKRDARQLSVINRKVQQILENPYHCKPLRGEMHGIRRVHIGKSFVLTYEIDEANKTVRLLDYAHHDVIYE